MPDVLPEPEPFGDRDLPIVRALREIVGRPQARFYLPGHKGGTGTPAVLRQLWGDAPWRWDLPELPDFDTLSTPTGAIAEAQNLAARAFGADRTWFLCNGSTAGVIAALSSVCGPGDRVLMPRNVHRSAIAGLIQSGARPVFAAPDLETDWQIDRGLTPDAVAAALERYPDLAAIFLVSPNYYGLSCDIATIAKLARSHQSDRPIPVVVDAAHGSHFAFHPDLPTSALAAGADLAIESTHKTLGALSQAAMLHLRGDRVDADRLDRALSLVQSTSPNALLLASLDAARHQMETAGRAWLDRALSLANRLREGLAELGWPVWLPRCETTEFDRTRVTVRTSDFGLSGYDVDDWLYERGVAAELPDERHLTFVVTLGNTDADIDLTLAAFRDLEAQRLKRAELADSPAVDWPQFTEPELSPREAFFSQTETVALSDSRDRISADTLCPYPPGIPLLFPGECITPGTLATLDRLIGQSATITGWPAPNRVRVVTK